MKFPPTFYLAAISLSLGLLSPFAVHAACGKVTIADMNWASAQIAASVDAFILKHGYGCATETVPGDTMPTAVSMTEKGRPDIAPELWLNNIKEPVEKAVIEKRLVIVGDVLANPGKNAGEGWWVPQYMIDKTPELATIEGVKKHAALFKDPEDPKKGRLLGCPAGWACQISTKNLYRAFAMKEAGFNLVDPGSGAALAGAIAKAYNRGEGVLTYYWAPTSLLSKFKMVRVDMGPHDKQSFETCTGVANCADPKPNSFAVSDIKTVITARFADKNPQPVAYLKARTWTPEAFGAVLTYMENEQANGQAAALWFLKNHEKTWSTWVPPEVVAKIKAAL